MKNQDLIKKIKQAAIRDQKKRRDPRYLRAMGFFTKKGFLRANQDFTPWQKGKLFVQDAIWAGLNLEPRILEVLPAAIARLPKEIVASDKIHKDLIDAVTSLNAGDEEGPTIFGIEFKTYKVWMQLTLIDRRTKPNFDKKLMRSFRLRRTAIERLKAKAKELGQSESDTIESFLT
jgi:hypothetical protein